MTFERSTSQGLLPWQQGADFCGCVMADEIACIQIETPQERMFAKLMHILLQTTQRELNDLTRLYLDVATVLSYRVNSCISFHS